MALINFESSTKYVLLIYCKRSFKNVSLILPSELNEVGKYHYKDQRVLSSRETTSIEFRFFNYIFVRQAYVTKPVYEFVNARG
jgi:hypothetical protein